MARVAARLMAPHPGSRITAATVVLRLDCAVGIGTGSIARRKRGERKEEQRTGVL